MDAARGTQVRRLEKSPAVSAYALEVAGITLAGLVLRLLLSARLPLGGDESFTGVVAALHPDGIIDVVRRDSGPPLDYLLVHFASQLWRGEVGVRLVSALAGSATIPIGAALARRLGGGRAGVLAALLIAALPSYVLFVVDARMYALAASLTTATTLAAWRAIEKPDGGRLTAYFCLAVLALHTSYFAAFAIAGQLLALALTLRPAKAAVLRLGGAATLAAISLVPWLLAASPQFQPRPGGFWVRTLNVDQAAGMLAQPIAGPWVLQSQPFSGLLLVIWGAALGAGYVALLGLPGWLRTASAAQRRGAAFLTACAVLPLAMLALLSVKQPLFEPRYASVLVGTLPPILAIGFAAMRRQRVTATCLVVLALAAVTLSLTSPRPDVSTLAARLKSHVGTQDLVALDGPGEYFPVAYYGHAATRSRLRIITSQTIPWYFGTAAIPTGAVLPRVPAVQGTVFVVFDAGQSMPPLPAGLYPRQGDCVTGVCVESFSR